MTKQIFNEMIETENDDGNKFYNHKGYFYKVVVQ